MGKISKAGSQVKTFLGRITAPLRKTKVWKFLRKTILRSPFGGYFVASWGELRKVTWPSRRTSLKLTLVVLVFSVVFSLFTASLDYGFEKLAQQIFLK